MRIDRYCIIAVAIVMLPILAACRRELCYDHYPTVDVSFTWEREWERDYGMYHFLNWDTDYYGNSYDDLRPWIPEWLTMIIYSPDNAPVEHFLSPEGSQLNIHGGTGYSFLIYNGDTECIMLSNMASKMEARASATSRSRATIATVLERHPNARTTNPPDILYSAYISDVPEVSNHEYLPMSVKMQPLVYTYAITYEFDKGIEHVLLARGALGGMAESVYLRDGRTSDDTSIILFDCDVKPNGCQTFVRSFGVPGFPDKYYGQETRDIRERSYTLNLEVMLRNGKTVEYNFDISDQIARQPRGGVIKVSGISIEEEQSNASGGFDVDVSDWGSGVVIDLPLGNQTSDQ